MALLIREYRGDADRPVVQGGIVALNQYLVDNDPLGRITLPQGHAKQLVEATLTQAAEGGVIFIAELDSAFVGLGVGGIGEKLGMKEAGVEVVAPCRVGVISDLYVVTDHRGKGVGRALVAALESFFLSEKCLSFSVAAMAFTDACGFYQHLGYGPRWTEFQKYT